MTRALILAATLALAPMPAHAKTGVLYMGLGDWFFAAPLYELAGELRRRGATVEVRPWWAPSSRRYDFAAGQSMGVMPASRANARLRIGIDPVRTDWRGIHVNFWTPPRLGFPPGRPLSRAKNIRIDSANHVSLPRVAKRQIADAIMGDRK